MLDVEVDLVAREGVVAELSKLLQEVGFVEPGLGQDVDCYLPGEHCVLGADRDEAADLGQTVEGLRVSIAASRR